MASTKTIFELIEEQVAAESAIFQEAFDLARYAGEAITHEQYAPVANALGDAEAAKVRANDLHTRATELRHELAERMQGVSAQFDAAKQQRQEALEAAVDPDGVDTGDLLQAAMASPEQLTSLADLALSLGNEDGVLLALRVARQNDMEEVEAHIRTVRGDLNEICSELDTIDDLPDYDPDDVDARFDSIAAGVPSREELLKITVLR
jgi:hypothetical protein